MKIHVTQEHINWGDSNSPQSCPIALAIKEQLPRAKQIGVKHTYAHMILDNKTLYLQFSRRTTKFIRYFDAGHEVEPFTFVLSGIPYPEAP